jgi:pimeloyl-ACP methyl ester carboxylesterase
MSVIRRTYADGRWGQVHLRICGEVAGGSQGLPPLLLLHPTPKSGWIYEDVMPALAEGRIVIAPDTPGYGASDAPPAPATMEDHAAALLALIRDLAAGGIIPAGPVDLLGYHTGSVLATAAALTEPEQVRRLILVSLAAYPPDIRAGKTAALDRWPGPREDGSHLTAMWTLMQTLFDPRIDLAWKHASLTENLRPGARTIWGYRAVYGYDFQAALDRLEHKTLILNPEDDLWQPTRDNAGRVRGARYVELPGVGHGLFTLEAERIAELVRGFLG